jgi:hypothetical protein
MQESRGTSRSKTWSKMNQYLLSIFPLLSKIDSVCRQYSKVYFRPKNFFLLAATVDGYLAPCSFDSNVEAVSSSSASPCDDDFVLLNLTLLEDFFKSPEIDHCFFFFSAPGVVLGDDTEVGSICGGVEAIEAGGMGAMEDDGVVLVPEGCIMDGGGYEDMYAIL